MTMVNVPDIRGANHSMPSMPSNWDMSPALRIEIPRRLARMLKISRTKVIPAIIIIARAGPLTFDSMSARLGPGGGAIGGCMGGGSTGGGGGGVGVLIFDPPSVCFKYEN